jgi:hypothetical protein
MSFKRNFTLFIIAFITSVTLILVYFNFIRTSRIELAKVSYADSQKNLDPVFLKILLNKNSFSKIISKELYAHGYLFDCHDKGDSYPFQFTYQQISLDNFDELNKKYNGEGDVWLQFSIPKKILLDYQRKCFYMSGGQMFGISKMKSNFVELN